MAEGGEERQFPFPGLRGPAKLEEAGFFENEEEGRIGLLGFIRVIKEKGKIPQ